jgi:hypothetical protein
MRSLPRLADCASRLPGFHDPAIAKPAKDISQQLLSPLVDSRPTYFPRFTMLLAEILLRIIDLAIPGVDVRSEDIYIKTG